MTLNARSILALAIIWAGGATAHAAPYRSPEYVAASPDGKMLYVTEKTAKQIAVVDAATAKVTKEIALRAEPTGLALSAHGKALCVTAGLEDGRLYMVDTDRRKVTDSVDVGHSPCAPALSPDTKTAYVCNRFLNSVAVVDLDEGDVVAHIPVVREPVASVITPDGKLLFVANLLPAGRATNDVIAAVVSVIDTATRKVVANLSLPNGSTSVRGIACSPDGRYVYATHTLARYQLPTTQLERGWMNTSAISILDVATRALVNTVLLDDVDLGAANPWGVACTADGALIAVAHAGTREVSLIDRAALHAKLDKVAKGEKVSEVSQRVEDVPNDLSFLVDLRRRVSLQGVGPRGVAAAGTNVYAAEYFSGTLAAIKTGATVAGDASAQVALGPEEKIDQTRRGELLFNDATMCFQHWQSCITCHPDVRTDGLNWDLLNDGIGNPKQTKSLLLSHLTPPAMISGIRESAEKAVRSGMKFIQFVVRPEEDALALDAYLKTVKPVASPYIADWSNARAARRGEKVFRTASCASCHSGPYHTDMQEHDVGVADGNEKGKSFDTPTLVEIWRTAPYLYDGRADTIKDVITTCNTNNTHGVTTTLSAKELADLEMYILSL
jgi:YVTN family beta-propeller protein